MAKNYISQNDNVKLYTIAILSLFDELVLINDANDEYNIPLYFGQGNRKVNRKDSTHTKPFPLYSQALPAMSLTIDNFIPNDERQTNKFLRRKRVSLDNNTTQHLIGWNDVSMDMNYNLKVRAKNIEELLRITEYITTVFKNGKYYMNINQIIYDTPISTPIILNTSDIEIDTVEDEASEYRIIEANLSFTIKGLFISNIESLSKTILRADLNIWKDEQFTELINSYTVEVI